MRPFQSEAIARVFDVYPLAIQKQALLLRELVYDAALDTPNVARLEETLKWGEPAYVAYGSRAVAQLEKSSSARERAQRGPRFASRAEWVIGSAVRIGWKANDPEHLRLLFNCQTSLIDSFRAQFGDRLTFEGNRAIVIHKDDALPEKTLAACVAASLTYHRDKKIS